MSCGIPLSHPVGMDLLVEHIHLTDAKANSSGSNLKAIFHHFCCCRCYLLFKFSPAAGVFSLIRILRSLHSLTYSSINKSVVVSGLFWFLF